MDLHNVHPVHDWDVTYTPWTDGHAVGFKVSYPDRPDSYVYLNPTMNDDNAPDEETFPVVFVYTGPAGKPWADSPEDFHTVSVDHRCEIHHPES